MHNNRFADWPGQQPPAAATTPAPAVPAAQPGQTPLDERQASALKLLNRVKIHPDGSSEIQLVNPVQAHTDTGRLDVLKLHAPTLPLVAELGEPVTLAEGKTIETASLLDYRMGPKFPEWLARLSGHDVGVISQMKLADARLCMFAVFFSSLAGGSG